MHNIHIDQGRFTEFIQHNLHSLHKRWQMEKTWVFSILGFMLLGTCSNPFAVLCSRKWTAQPCSGRWDPRWFQFWTWWCPWRTGLGTRTDPAEKPCILEHREFARWDNRRLLPTSVCTMRGRCMRRSWTMPKTSTIFSRSIWKIRRSMAMKVPVRPTPALTGQKHTHLTF